MKVVRVERPMRTHRRPDDAVRAACAVAACVTANSAHASSRVQFGIQDDAWLEFGPGNAQPAADDARAARRADRPLHAALEPDRPATTEGADLAARSRVRLAPVRSGSAWASQPRSDARGHACRHAGVGERGRAPQYAPPHPRLRPLRDRRRAALSVGSTLADLERAEQASLAQADEGGHLRPASAQPRVRGDPRRVASCSGRRRRDRSQGRGGRRLTRHLGPRHGRRPREARRLRPPPLPLDAVRDAVQRRLQELPVDHDGDDQEAPHPRQAPLRVEADLADGVRLPDEPAGHVPGRDAQAAGDKSQPRRDAGVEAATSHDADPVPLPRRAPAQPLPDRPRLRGRPLEALTAGIQAALRADGPARSAGSRLGPDPRRSPGGSATGSRCSSATCGSLSAAPG